MGFNFVNFHNNTSTFKSSYNEHKVNYFRRSEDKVYPNSSNDRIDLRNKFYRGFIDDNLTLRHKFWFSLRPRLLNFIHLFIYLYVYF